MAELDEEEEIKAPLLPESTNSEDASPDLEAAAAAEHPHQEPEGSNNVSSNSNNISNNNNTTKDEMGVESLDYDPIFNIVHAKTSRAKKGRRVYGYTGLTLAKWSITICIGFLVGLTAYVMESGQELLVSRKKRFMEATVASNTMLSFLGFASFSVLLVVVASCLVLFWAPPAAGGGVTLVMAYLNGNDIPDFFKFSTLVAKVVGTICSISSGLLVGQEAPMVHVGAAIASTLTWMHCKFDPRKRNASPTAASIGCCGTTKSPSFDFHNDKDRREFISAGAAAGLAAAFGAPIGGVLYSLEEASSFWSKKVMWRSLLCCTCATMLLALINKWEFSMSLPGSMAFRHLKPDYELGDLPFFIATSISAGIIGAFVNIAHMWTDRLRPAGSNKRARLLEACSITLASVAVMYGLPLVFGKCLQVPDAPLPDEKMDERYWVSYRCPKDEGTMYYNDLATLFFSLPRKSMQQLYGMQPAHPYPTLNLAIYTASVLVLFIAAYGIATPGGIFMPSMLAGASFGAFMGGVFQQLFPGMNIQPGLHAIVGSTAMLGGVFRASISLVVIMVEGTGGIDFILPIIIAIVVSNWVAHHISHAGAYEADLERLGGVYFLQSEPPHQLVTLTAADIMSHNVVCFNEVVPVREVVEVLRSTRHNGFPVLRCSPPHKFVGLILRHQLLLLLEQGFFVEVESTTATTTRQHRPWLHEKIIPEEMRILEHAMQAYHHWHYPHRRFLSSRPQALDDIGVDNINGTNAAKVCEDKGNVLALDLRPFMNRAPLTVPRECSAQRVYMIFRTLGLRHLCVTDSQNKVIGIITRKDIVAATKQDFTKRSLQHWDSDTRSFMELDEDAKNKNKNKLYNLP